VKERAVAVIVHGERLLVIHRRKNGTEYFTLPGGGVEDGETVEQACLREVLEETGLEATLGRHLTTFENAGRTEHYHLVEAPIGDPMLGGPEARINSPENLYTLLWVSLDELAGIDLKPPTAKELILQLPRS
jgi:ADP-ribose pyrophosphatase YjhB (NUDIX family)